MHTETLSIGSELVAGTGIDTNVAHLANQVARLGLAVRRHTILPDRLDDVADFVRTFCRSAPRPAMLLATGGLGPTLDDVTRDAVAQAMNAPLAENAECRNDIETWFRARGRALARSNLRQAMIPAGAVPLPNSCGTAPGFHLASDDVHVVCMPGVPVEMQAMFAEHVLPILRGLVGAGGGLICERIIRTFGMGESRAGELIADLMAPGRNPQVGTLASSGVVSVRIRATAASEAEAAAMLDHDEAAVRQRLGRIVVGRDGDLLPQVVARLLTGRGATLAVAESCTGGLISAMITDVPGASRFLVEGVVAYANEAKTRRLDVPARLLEAHGAVSDPVARAMAENLRRAAGTTYALATTGIAGPAGGTRDKPVGLVFIALAGPEGTSVQRAVFPGDRVRVRHRTAQAALNLLRLRLQGNDDSLSA